MTLKELLARLKTIADANGDDFEGSIKIPLQPRSPTSRIEFVESAEKHNFLDTKLQGSLYDMEVTATEEELKSACELWGYKYPAPPVEKIVMPATGV